MGDCTGSVCGYFPSGARELPFVFFPLSDFHLLRNLSQGRHFVFVFACGVLCFAFCLLDLCVFMCVCVCVCVCVFMCVFMCVSLISTCNC